MFGAGRVADTYTVAPGPCSPQNIGVNAVLLPVIPYTLVTAIHDTNLHLALILGTAFSGGILLLGLVFKILGGYRTWPFLLELVMLTVNVVLLGVSYLEDQEHDIRKYLPFMTNASYATFALVSVCIKWPFTQQYVQEFVPPVDAGADKVKRCARQTGIAFTLAFVASTLLYLVPICRGQWANHDHAFNLLFRIILPIFFFLFAALYTRVWPIKVLNHFERSTPFDHTALKVVVNPLALEEVRPGPGLAALGPGPSLGPIMVGPMGHTLPPRPVTIPVHAMAV